MKDNQTPPKKKTFFDYSEKEKRKILAKAVREGAKKQKELMEKHRTPPTLEAKKIKQELSELFVEWGMPTRQIVLNKITKMIMSAYRSGVEAAIEATKLEERTRIHLHPDFENLTDGYNIAVSNQQVKAQTFLEEVEKT